MLKRMKKVYDTEFYEVDNEWGWCKERFYEISSNENEINLITKQQSNSILGLSRLKCTLIFNIRWDDDLGIVVPVGKRVIQRRNIVGTVSKVSRKDYFLLLRRMNCYA